jgi:hypothetical protein
MMAWPFGPGSGVFICGRRALWFPDAFIFFAATCGGAIVVMSLSPV